MVPAQQIALSHGLSKQDADIIAWKAGIIACLGSGIVEVVGSFFVHHIRKVAPRAALLSALAVIGIFFIAADYCFRAYASSCKQLYDAVARRDCYREQIGRSYGRLFCIYSIYRKCIYCWKPCGSRNNKKLGYLLQHPTSSEVDQT